jgi:hypothetical protein
MLIDTVPKIHSAVRSDDFVEDLHRPPGDPSPAQCA